MVGLYADGPMFRTLRNYKKRGYGQRYHSGDSAREGSVEDGLYTYACDTCNSSTEVREKISDPPEPMPCNVARAYFQAIRPDKDTETPEESAAGLDELWRLLMDDSCPGRVTRRIGGPALRFEGSGLLSPTTNAALNDVRSCPFL